MGLLWLVLVAYGGILSGLTKSTDHPSKSPPKGSLRRRVGTRPLGVARRLLGTTGPYMALLACVGSPWVGFESLYAGRQAEPYIDHCIARGLWLW